MGESARASSRTSRSSVEGLSERERFPQGHDRRAQGQVGHELHGRSRSRASRMPYRAEGFEDRPHALVVLVGRTDEYVEAARRRPGAHCLERARRRGIRAFGKRAAAERTSSGPTVDMSIKTWPGESAGASPAVPNRTCSSASGVASIVMTKSAPAAAFAGEARPRRLPAPAARSAPDCDSRPSRRDRRGANGWPSACPSLPAPGIQFLPYSLPPTFGPITLRRDHAVRIDDEFLRGALVEIVVARGASSSEMTVTFTALAIWILSCRMAFISRRLYFITGV